MDSPDTPVGSELGRREAFSAKLAAAIAKSEEKAVVTVERRSLARTFFGGKKATAAAPASSDARGENPVPASIDNAAVSITSAQDAPAPETTPPSDTTTQPAPAMSSDLPATTASNHAAQAQLSLNFEITSLQLTPFFKLGGVQLKAVSNVVSLHLITAQTQENPLAANISFQIDHVVLDDAQRLKSLVLKPLGESRTLTAPTPKLQVDAVAISGGQVDAPISITTGAEASTAVQIFGTFTIAGMDFTPSFEIEALRLDAAGSTVLLRVAPSARPTAVDLPPSFEITRVQLGDGGQIAGMSISPSASKGS